MRRDDQPIKQESEAVGFNFHFQIANGTGRKACSVRVQACNFHDATDFFRQNWPAIELMARESLAVAADGTEITIAMPPTQSGATRIAYFPRRREPAGLDCGLTYSVCDEG
jgi:hypothetical protein